MLDIEKKVQADHRNRISRETLDAPSAAAQLAKNPYISPEDLIQTIVNEDPELSLFAVSQYRLKR